MSKFFGDPWPSGICDDGEQVDTPIGQECLLCGDPIMADDQGSFTHAVILHHVRPHRPVHRECSLREVLGGIGHHNDHALWCTQRHDPDGGLSYRASALAVWELVHRYDVV